MLPRATRASLFKRSSVSTHWHTRSWTRWTRTTDALTIHSLNNTSFPYIWLRDSCHSSKSIHPHSQQKLHRSSDIPLTIAPISKGGVELTRNGINIVWNDDHESSFPKWFLERHASTSKLPKWRSDYYDIEKPWTRESISDLPDLFLSYNHVNESSGLVQAITQLSQYGLAFIRGVPNQNTSHNTCELRTLAARLGEIRSTFYGPLWDVVNGNNDGKNIAYTNLDLGLHMDLLYFQHPPRYQILHCLRNQVIGGTSIFVDALHVAHELRKSHPNDFDILTKTPVAFHYIVDGHHLYREHPTIQLAPPSMTSTSPEPQILHINYSPPFQAPLPLNTPMEFYPALARFAEMLNDPKNTYEYTLREGDAVLFDNRRVLHARTAFTDKPGVDMVKGEINRWLKGCYLEADAVVDRVRALRKSINEESYRRL